MQDIVVVVEFLIAFVAPFVIQWFKKAGYDLKGIKVQFLNLAIAVVLTVIASLIKGFSWWESVSSVFALMGVIQVAYGLIVKNVVPTDDLTK